MIIECYSVKYLILAENKNVKNFSVDTVFVSHLKFRLKLKYLIRKKSKFNPMPAIVVAKKGTEFAYPL